PFASFGPKFLKFGSNFDFIKHLKKYNLSNICAAAIKNTSLIKYSISQFMMNKEDKMNELRHFIPDADTKDWYVVTAGKRVQIIKDVSKQKRGELQFGTEIVNASDATLSVL